MTTPTAAPITGTPAAGSDHTPSPAAVATAPAPAANAVRQALANIGTRAPQTFLDRLRGRCPLPVGVRDAFVAARRHVDLAERLQGLGESWTVFESPSLALGAVATDFVAVGPAGIIAIGSSTSVNASPDEAAASHATAFRMAVSRAMQTDVPVLTYYVGRTSAPERDDVVSVHADDLVDQINDLPHALTAAQVTALARLVGDTVDPDARTTPTERMAFEALDQTVTAAKRTRIRWGVGLGITALAAIVAVVLLVA